MNGAWRALRQSVDELLLTSRPRIGPLDGLRTIAIATVILRHTFDRPLQDYRMHPAVAAVMGFGWVGVQLFFTLSGFLIGGHIFEALDKGDFSFARFYKSRAFRILPAAFAAMAIFGGASFGANAKTLLNVSFLANYRPNRLFSPVLWSLCVEEQFYILFPAVAAFLLSRDPARRVRGLAAAATGIVVARTALILWARDPSLLASWSRQTWFHADFLLLGALAAALRGRGLPRLPAFLRLWWLIPAGYAALAWYTGPLNLLRPAMEPSPLSLGYSFIAAWCFLLVLCASVEDGRTARFLSLPAFRWTAALSYSMYLFHLKVNDKIHPFLNYHFSLPYPDRPALVLGVAYGMMLAGSAFYAGLAFLLIERPMLVLRDRVLSRRERAAAAPATAAVPS